MRLLLLVALFLLSTVGCTKGGERSNVAVARDASTAAAQMLRTPNRYLAVQHTISVDVAEQQIAVLYEAGLAACRDAASEACVALESHITTGRQPSATLKFRAKATGIRKLMDIFGARGSITNQTTIAEDLTAPVEDTARRVAMLTEYRSKLESLLGRASGDVDALIKVNRELAQVQSEFEAMKGQQASLVQRVETEILSVSIVSIEGQTFWAPISASLAEFLSNLSRGISSAVTGVAYLIPWSVLLLVFGWVGLKMWRRQRRAPAHA